MARGTPLRVLVAPDSFKGTFTSVEVAEALARGWRVVRPADSVSLTPMADGGEGTLDAVAASGRWGEMPAAARDPRMEPISSRFLRDGDEAVIEMAAASGLSLVPTDERDAMTATTFGTGQVLAAAIGLGCRRVVIGLGGSATTDGGVGLLTALGARFTDTDGDPLAPGGGALADLSTVDLSDVAGVLSEVSLVVASDVTNPLLGELGAAATYGPQKGASAAQVAELDAGLAHYADVVESTVGRRWRDRAGSGAAGGTTFGLLAIADRFASFDVEPGVEVVMGLTGFRERLGESDLVLTGEGQVDAQTAYGKTAMGVATRAAAHGLRTICFGGGVTAAGHDVMAAMDVVAVPVTEAPMSLAEHVAAGTAPISRAAERVARVLDVGMHL